MATKVGNTWPEWKRNMDTRSDSYKDMTDLSRNKIDSYIQLIKTLKESGDSPANKVQVAKYLKQMAKIYQDESKTSTSAAIRDESLRVANYFSDKAEQLEKNNGDNSTLIPAESDVQYQKSSDKSEKATTSANESTTTEQYKSILAMYSADGTASGKIDVSKMIRELQTAKYSKEDTTAVLNTMYEIQNIPEAQRSQMAADAIESANKTSLATPTVDHQATL
jgi:arginine repressor